jgi:UDP-glucose 4-epimerase
MKVLITGVAGFIGSNLLDYLLEHSDFYITGVDNLSTGNRNNIAQHIGSKRFVFQEKECSQIESLKQFDRVFHLAALPRIQPSFEFINEHVNANLVNGIHLLEVMIRENHFPRIIYSGSSAIYGTPKNIPTAEGEVVDCLSPYAFQKYEFEKYMELIASRYPLDYATLRYFNPYGPRSFNPSNKFNAYSSVVGIFLNKYKNGEELLVTGDGEQKRDFIHVYDLASANHKAAIQESKLNTAFNIGNGSTLSILELAKMISPRYKFIPKREGEADITFADIAKARKILKWEPKHKLQDYLQKIIEEK